MAVAGTAELVSGDGGTIALTGVGTGSVTSAWLYWSGATNSTDPPANATITFNGTAITGTSIAVGPEPCAEYALGYSQTQAFRADVTALVTGDGNYVLADTRKDSPDAQATGASLIVFFDDADPSNNQDVYLYDGLDANFLDPSTRSSWNTTMSGIDYAGGPATMTLHVEEGEPGVGDDSFLLNGTTFASGDVFTGAWDIKSWDITSWLTPGTNSLALTHEVTTDCMSLIVATVSVATDATAPTIQPLDDQTLDPTSQNGAPVVFTPVVADDQTPTDQLVVSCVDGNNQPFVSGQVAPIGTTTITCTVTDLASNTASESFVVTVRSAADLLAQLRADTISLVDNASAERALLTTLDSTQQALDRGNSWGVYTSILRYVLQLNQYGKTRAASPAAGQQLIGDAQQFLRSVM